MLRFPRGEEAKSYNVLQKIAYFGGGRRARAGADPGRHDHVAWHGRGLPVAARSFRRTADGAHHPFHRCGADPALRVRARHHGSRLGRLEQPALDDHRALSDRRSGGAACRGIDGSEPSQAFCVARAVGGEARWSSAAAMRCRRRRGFGIFSSAPSA